MGDLGDNVQSYINVSEKDSYMPHFALHDRRIPTKKLSRISIPVTIPQALQSVGTYVVGIVPHDSHVVDIRHVCGSIEEAAKVEVQIGTQTGIMTAQDGSETVAEATLASDTDDREVDAGDIISVIITESSGDLLRLAVLITLEPIE